MRARISSLAVGALALALMPYGTLFAHDALPTHNFVSLDLASAGPPPLASNARRNEIDLLDSASVTHTGDTVAFDILVIRRDTIWTSSGSGVHPAEPMPTTHIEHRTASCGWRSLGTTTIALGSTHQYSMQDQFLDPDSPMFPIVDKLCAGRPLATPTGAASEADAVDIWKDQFGSPPSAPAVLRARPRPQATTWMTDVSPHRFVVVHMGGGASNMSFLDKAGIIRNGQTVTALSLALLAPQPDRTPFQMAPVAALRDVRYDCAGKTMTVLAQATWNKAMNLTGVSETGFAPRSASESPVIAREIDAVCRPGDDADTAPSFDSVEAASAFAHQKWQDFNSPNTQVKVESH